MAREDGLRYPSPDSEVTPRRHEDDQAKQHEARPPQMPHITGHGDIVGIRMAESCLRARRAMTPKPGEEQ